MRPFPLTACRAHGRWATQGPTPGWSGLPAHALTPAVLAALEANTSLRTLSLATNRLEDVGGVSLAACIGRKLRRTPAVTFAAVLCIGHGGGECGVCICVCVRVGLPTHARLCVVGQSCTQTNSKWMGLSSTAVPRWSVDLWMAGLRRSLPIAQLLTCANPSLSLASAPLQTPRRKEHRTARRRGRPAARGTQCCCPPHRPGCAPQSRRRATWWAAA